MPKRQNSKNHEQLHAAVISMVYSLSVAVLEIQHL